MAPGLEQTDRSGVRERGAEPRGEGLSSTRLDGVRGAHAVLGGVGTNRYLSSSLRASKSDEYRRERNWSSVCAVSLAKTCSTTPISASL